MGKTRIIKEERRNEREGEGGKKKDYLLEGVRSLDEGG